MPPAHRRARFRALHATEQLFVMPNPWDVGSACLLASFGFEALATSSAGFAWSIGKLDQTVRRDELVAHVATLANATALPLNVDSERCYPDEPGGGVRDGRAARRGRSCRLLDRGLRPCDRGHRRNRHRGRTSRDGRRRQDPNVPKPTPRKAADEFANPTGSETRFVPGSARRSIASHFSNSGGCAWAGRWFIWDSAGCFSWSFCCADGSVRRNSKSCCSGMSWRACVGGRGAHRSDPWIGGFLRRSPGSCRGAPGQACRCVRRRCCAGTGSSSAGAGRTRTDAQDAHRSIVGCRRSLFGSPERIHVGATSASSANCETLGSLCRRPRCGRSSFVAGCRPRRSEMSSHGAIWSRPIAWCRSASDGAG
jgi:Phosphoenolpyruvate phosphomutase